MEKASFLNQIENVTVLCPYRNEEILLPEFKNIAADLARNGAEVIFVDSHSEDRSHAIVDTWDFPNMHITLESKKASIGQAVFEGSALANREFVLVLPVDIRLYPSQLLDFENHLNENIDMEWGGFPKIFTNSRWYYRIYSWIQNEVRLKILKKVVWTNVIFARKDLVRKYLSVPQGFMEDTQLSDSLRQYKFEIPSSRPVIVSDRKFVKKPKFQMIKNVVILVLYRLKICSLNTLRKIYYSN